MPRTTRRMRERRLDYGEAFRVVRNKQAHGSKADANLYPAAVGGVRNDTTMLDGALQVLLSLVPDTFATADETLVPVFIERARVLGSGWSAASEVHAEMDDANAHVGSVQLRGSDGMLFCDMFGVEFSVVRQDAAEELPSMRYVTAWMPVTPAPREAAGPQHWLVIGDNTGIASIVTTELRAKGDGVSVWTPADVAGATCLPDQVTALIVLSALDVIKSESGAPTMCVESALQLAYDVPLRALQLAALAPRALSRTLLVTRGAVAAAGVADVTAPLQSVLWGLGRVSQHENTVPDVQLIDLDVAASVREQSRALTRLAVCAPDDSELAIRGDTVSAGRISNEEPRASDYRTDRIPSDAETYAAEVGIPGVIESLQWRVTPRPHPGKGEVEIAVSATGLNFINVISALGTYREASDGVGPART